MRAIIAIIAIAGVALAGLTGIACNSERDAILEDARERARTRIAATRTALPALTPVATRPASKPATRAPAPAPRGPLVYTFANGARWRCDDLAYEFAGAVKTYGDEFIAHTHIANLVTLNNGNVLALQTGERCPPGVSRVRTRRALTMPISAGAGAGADGRC